MKRRKLEYLPVYLAEQVASIIGPSSAAARALAEMKRRQENGEVVCLFTSGNSIIVGIAPDGPARQVELIGGGR